jgi:tetratricopeptide (TPR) repeat protein
MTIERFGTWRGAAAALFTMVLLPAAAVAQGARPTRTPTPPTAEQDAAVRAGARLHDEGKYDEAIAAYRKVLDQAPDNTVALYELAFTYAAKKDYAACIETARHGAEYDSEQLPLFYDVMAFSQDAMGEPRQAVDTYRRGIELVPDSSELYFNLAVTYLDSLHDEAAGRQALERAAVLDPAHAETALLLGESFQRAGYTTPALLALSMSLILEPTGRGSSQGYGLWRIVLRGGADDSHGGLAPATAQQPAKTDEGDFGTLDAAIGRTHVAAVAAQDGGATEIAALAGQLDSLIGLLSERRVDGAPAFVDAHYVPFFVELKRREFVEPFVYWVSQRSQAPDVQAWLQRNRPKVQEFLEWTKSYEWPR